MCKATDGTWARRFTSKWGKEEVRADAGPLVNNWKLRASQSVRVWRNHLLIKRQNYVEDFQLQFDLWTLCASVLNANESDSSKAPWRSNWGKRRWAIRKMEKTKQKNNNSELNLCLHPVSQKTWSGIQMYEKQTSAIPQRATTKKAELSQKAVNRGLEMTVFGWFMVQVCSPAFGTSWDVTNSVTLDCGLVSLLDWMLWGVPRSFYLWIWI